ncbi:hypothetical protein LZ009_16735 [Ramlibacter sp. XY19]|uniref:hypothetical protein n=1 Tax=Ramlibacter paludis TaxID=2908000 RepID=UPI0023DAA54E|nr:hypothetical protein [Ramlibacter paludis]MCG2594425.1 hypothetical protein [Ramlibacter paludis]
MRLSVQQMQVLSEHAREAGNRRVAAYVDARFPQVFAGRDDAQRCAAVERMRESAAAFGLERDDHLGSYIVLHLMYGPGFEKQEWAAPVLANSLLSPQEKIRTLERRVRAAGGTP